MCTDCASEADWFSCCITSLASFPDHSHVQVWLLAIRTIGQHKEWKHLSITGMHVTSYATHTRRREAGHTIRQWIGPKCMSIRDLFIRDTVNEHSIQCNVHGMCSTHQTPAQLYQPAWGDHHQVPHRRNVSIPQMLWHVPGLGPSRRQWGCALTGAVYLQEEWAVEREDNWLVDTGSRYTVSILLYNCADPEPDQNTYIANCGKTLPLPTSVDKSYSHPCHPVGIARETWARPLFFVGVGLYG